MGMLALALFIGLLAIALAILRVAHVLDAIRLQSIVIANEAIQSYDAAHKLIRSAVSPPQKEVEFESKTPRSRWTPPEVK